MNMIRSFSRKDFIKLSAGAVSYIAAGRIQLFSGQGKEVTFIRLGGPVMQKYQDPDEWIQLLKLAGYRAAYCPVDATATPDEIKAYRNAASSADIVIAEVGAWSNPLSPDELQRKSAIKQCIEGLQLADEIGANCCVNISGSRNRNYWAGPHPDNLSEETFDLVVETTRKIIDAVNPGSTFFSLEAMPWSFPYSPDSYLDLIRAIDRKHFGVHLDPVNMIISPQVYFRNGALIKECFSKLGPYIRSCHAKDILLKEDVYMPQLEEVRPGMGTLDYAVFLQELAKLNNVPLMMEHLQTEEEYRQAGDYIRSAGRQAGILI